MSEITTLTKTGMLFGIALFYIIFTLFAGWMDFGLGTISSSIHHNFGSGDVAGNYYNDTSNIYSPVSFQECNNAHGDFGLNSITFAGECVIPNDAVDTNFKWSFSKVLINIKELGWLNIILFAPLIGLVGFMFATSSVFYNVP